MIPNLGPFQDASQCPYSLHQRAEPIKNTNGWALVSGTTLFLALTRHQHHEKETKQETSVYRMIEKKPTK
jgi:hypothetical protein